MKITDILNKGGLTVSFEVFPPKTSTVFESVRSACETIAELHPSFMSVTYGAGGGTSKYTLEIAENIKKLHGVPSIAHLTCVSSTKETVKARIDELRAAGIENIMALRGDLPKEHTPGDYIHATDLITELRRVGNGSFCIGAACYPEVHPESKNSDEDIKYLCKKVESGVDFLTSQMFFDNSLFYSFLYRIREAGITVPVLPGIMPITSATQITRARELSGSFMPKRFLSIVDKFGDSPRAMMQAGIAYATDQIIDLFANGIKHVHIYTMNKPEVASAILANISDIVTL